MSYELHYSYLGIPKISIRDNESYEEFYTMEDACSELNKLYDELNNYKKKYIVLKKSLDEAVNVEKMLK